METDNEDYLAGWGSGDGAFCGEVMQYFLGGCAGSFFVARGFLLSWSTGSRVSWLL